jgi:hypothetical protein
VSVSHIREVDYSVLPCLGVWLHTVAKITAIINRSDTQCPLELVS